METIPDSDDEELLTEQQIHRHVSSLTRRAPTVQDGRCYITIDTACENTVCGSSILDLIVRRFLEDYHIVPKIETESERYCFGPGEPITSSTRVSLPIAVQGVAMVVNTSTIEQAPGRAPVPFLAGQDWLLFVKAIIDVGAGIFSMPDIGVTAPLLIDHTGHLVIAIDEFPDGKWPHGLNPKAIGYEGIVFDPYWADSSQPLDVDKIFVNEGPDPLAGREIYASDRFDRFESTKFESTKYHLKTSPNYFYEPNDDDFFSNQNLTRGPCTVKPDYWEFQFDKGMIIRHHCRPRSRLFSPTDDRSGPDPDTLSLDRVTVVKGLKDVVRDVWTPLEAQQELPFVWTGFTVLFLKDVSVQCHSLFQPQPVAGVDIVFPDGSEHVVSAKSLQPHANKKILQFDLDVTPPIFERAPSKRSDRFTIPPKQFGSRAASQRQLTREHRLRPGLHGQQASSEGMAAPDHGHRTSLDAPGQVGRHQPRHQRVQAPVSGPDGLHGGNDAPAAADASDGAAGDDQSSGSDSQGLAIGLSAADPSLPPRGGVSSAPGQCTWEVSGMSGLRAAEESSSVGLHGADQQGEGPRVCLPPRLSSAARRKSNKVRPQAKGGGVLWQLGRLLLAVLATGFGGFHQRCGLEEEGGPQSQEQDQAEAIFAEALLGDSFQGRGRQLGQGDGGQRRGGVRWLDEHAPDPDDWHHLKPGIQRRLKHNMRRALAMSRASRKAVQDKMATSSWPRRTFGYDIIEIFGGTSMISLRAGRNWGLKVLQPIDIRYGVDLRQRKWRRWLLRKLDVWNPRLAIVEYPCTVWSILQHHETTSCLCQFGMTGRHGLPMLKRVRFISTHKHFTDTLNRKCDFSHEHEAVAGSNTALSAAYPPDLADAICRAYLEIKEEEDFGLKHTWDTYEPRSSYFVDVDRTEDKWMPLFDLVQEQLARKVQSSMFLDPSTDLFRKIQALTPWQIANVQLSHLPKAKRVRPGLEKCHRASVMMLNDGSLTIETEYLPDAQAPRERFVTPVRWAIFILGYAPGEPKEPSPAALAPEQHLHEDLVAVADPVHTALQEEGLVRQDFAGECWFVGPPLTSAQKKLAVSLVRMHRNLGHPRQPDFTRALAQQDRLEPEVLALSRRLRCATCERTKRPLPPRPSSLKSTPPFNTKLSIDFVYLHDVDGEKFNYLHVLDPAGGFNVFALVPNREPATTLDTFAMSWTNWAGFPKQIRLDRDGAFEGIFQEKLTNMGIELDYIPAEAHWQSGDVEAFNRAFRNVGNRLIDEFQVKGEQDMRLLGAQVAASLNDRVRMSGASANEWVFGRNPSFPADLLDFDGKAEALMGMDRDSQLRWRQSVRSRADTLISEYRTNEALQKAVLRQSRPPRQRYEPGELVAFWRNIKKKKGKLVQPGWFRGTIIGPQKGSEEGKQSNYWVTSNGRCILVSLEQLRPAYGTELWPIAEDDLQWLEDNMPDGYYDERGDAPMLDDGQEVNHEAIQVPLYEPAGPEEKPEETLPPPQPPEVPAGHQQVPDQPAASSAPSDATQPHQSSHLHSRAPGTPISGLFKAHHERQQAQEPEAKRMRADEGLHQPRPHEIPVPDDEDFDMGLEPPPRPLHETDSVPDEQVSSVLAAALAEDKWHVSNDRVWLVRSHNKPRRRLFSPYEAMASPVNPHRLGQARQTKLKFVNTTFTYDPDSVKDQIVEDTWEKDKMQPDKGCAWVGKTRFRIACTTRKELKQLEKEIPWHLIPDEEREGYREALVKEWSVWLRYGAVVVLDLEASRYVEDYVDAARILNTRVCYRNKNAAYPWLPVKHKARLVCRGDQDPDLTTLRRDAPTMSRAGMFCLLQLAASHPGWFLFNSDITGAFLQGDQSLAARKEPLFLKQPREGLPGMHPKQLMMVVRGIFGLANSPRLFWRHLRDTLIKIGFRQSTLDRAMFFYYKDERLILALGAHVDDLLGTGEPGTADQVLDQIKQAFDFGAWADDRTDDVLEYGGKQIRRKSDGTILLSQDKFIRATSVTPVPKWRSATPNAPLLASEMTELRSVGGCLHWIVGQTRPDLAAGTSMHMSGQPTVESLLQLNKLLKEAKQSEDWALQFRPIDLEKSMVVVFSDASFANTEGLRSQAGYLVFVAEDTALTADGGRASLMDWRSHKIKRQCRSTLAAETMSLDAAVDSGLYIREILAEALIQDYVPCQSGRLPASFIPMAAATDCRSLYDLLVKDSALSTTQEKRLAIDIGGLKETAAEFDEQQEQLAEVYKWVDTHHQMADHLTKQKAPALLRELLDESRIALKAIEEPASHEFLHNRECSFGMHP